MRYSARAYAKTNLFLDVTSKRPDGYHDIDTVMQSLSLYDEICLELTESGIEMICDNEKLAGENNIAYRACELFMEASGVETGVRVEIHKNIPIAAGLGGGSADAAAVLVLLNIATGVNYPNEKLIPIAAKLGADVPFFLVGGTVRAQGIGDIITKLPDTELNFVLLKEQVKQSTGAMYSRLDDTADRIHGDVSVFIKSLSEKDLTAASREIFNSFEACWNMNELSAAFASFSPLKIFLSGSGPTVCALFKTKKEAADCAVALGKDGYNAFCVGSVPFGVEIV